MRELCIVADLVSSDQHSAVRKQNGGMAVAGRGHAAGGGEGAWHLRQSHGCEYNGVKENTATYGCPLHALDAPDHWTAMLTGVPVIQAALTWIVAGPFAVSEGTRKFTWYPSTEPG